MAAAAAAEGKALEPYLLMPIVAQITHKLMVKARG
jgi:hypothetical protein